jgi:hypothetical protein
MVPRTEVPVKVCGIVPAGEETTTGAVFEAAVVTEAGVG